MAELLDRAYQRELLQGLASIYPRKGGESAADNRYLVNAYYLHEHGLIEAKITETLDGIIHIHWAKIKKSGLDFIQDDGGLTAILGTVTIKFHDETIRALLVSKIESADGDETTKARLISALKDLPAEGLKRLAEKAMNSGLDNWPAAIEPLRGLLGL